MAEQLEFFPVPSPCKGICQVDNKGYCLGCMRNRDERFKWMTYSDAEKKNIIRLCRLRFQRMRRGAQLDTSSEPEQPSLF